MISNNRKKLEMLAESLLFEHSINEWSRPDYNGRDFPNYSMYNRAADKVDGDNNYEPSYKEKFELPRFPINENYGKLDRFKTIINTFPLEYKKILPLEKKLSKMNNPPNFQVEFFIEQQNIQNINCFSNEGDIWEKSNTKINNNILTIKFREPFKPRRGRINCSLNDNGKWRWFGTQFVIK